jgi:hypothetical protein
MANFMPKKKKPTEEEEPREKRSCNYKEKGTCIQVQKKPVALAPAPPLDVWRAYGVLFK